MRINQIFFYLFFLSSLFLISKTSFANKIIKSSVGENSGKVRIAFELQKFPKYRVFTTSKPLQLIIDIQDCSPIGQINLDHEFFKKITTSSNSTDDLRI